MATSSQLGGRGYINAREGDEYHIQYVGLYREDAGWLYVKSRYGKEGWLSQDCLEIVS